MYNRDIDICGISEHWLKPHNIHFLHALTSDYSVHAVCDKDSSLRHGVGKGGVAIMWHKRLNNVVTPICIDDDRIVAVQVQISDAQYLYFFQVYLPCTNHSVAIYSDYIDILYVHSKYLAIYFKVFELFWPFFAISKAQTFNKTKGFPIIDTIKLM